MFVDLILKIEYVVGVDVEVVDQVFVGGYCDKML